MANDLDGLLEKAQQLMSTGRLLEAAGITEQVLGINPNHGDALHLLAIVHAQTGRLKDAVELLNKALIFVPNDSDAHSNLGHLLRQSGDLSGAESAYAKAVGLRLEFPEAWLGLGQIYRGAGRLEEAERAYSAAIQAGARSAENYKTRGEIHLDLGQLESALADFDRALSIAPRSAGTRSARAIILARWNYLEAAEAEHRRVVSIDPNFADGYSNFADFLLQTGRYEEALESASRAIALQPDLAEAYWNAALALLHLGRYQEAWARYEWRWHCGFFRRIHSQVFPFPLLTPNTPVAGKRVLVFSEQGYGDTIQFVRFLKNLREEGARVTLLTYERLVDVFTQSLQGLDIGVSAVAREGGQFDFAIALMSLPLRYSISSENIPLSKESYISPDPEKVAVVSGRFPKTKKPRIGVMWCGGDHDKLQRRSIPLPALSELISDRFDWVGLPIEIPKQEQHLLRWFPELKLCIEHQKNFADTAAIISTCNLIVTVDTSVAHLAGAMGVETWVLLPKITDWRWTLDSDRSRWYPSVRLFRQLEPNDWTGVIEQVRLELDQRFG